MRRNISSLFLLQTGNYLVPLLTLPWLSRVLGVDAFGQLSFITAFLTYFVLLVDWGFSLSATRQIAIHRDNLLERSKIFWSVLCARLLLAVIGFLVMSGLLLIIPRLGENGLLFLPAYFMVLGTCLTPAFYYQGIERMGTMALVNAVVKFSSIPFIFWFVKSQADIGVAIGIQAGFIFLAGLANFVVLWRSDQLVWLKPTIAHIWNCLWEGWPLFLSTASISLYTNSNTVILGFVANTAAVAYFTAAQTVIRAGQGLYGPISQALFPRMSHLFHHSKDSALVLLRRVLWVQGALTACITCIFWIAAPWLMKILFGDHFEQGASVLRWLAPLIFLIGLSNVFGIQGMVPLGHSKPFSRILLASGILNIVIIFPLGYLFGADGAATAVLMTELFVTALMGFYLAFKEPKLFKMKA